MGLGFARSAMLCAALVGCNALTAGDAVELEEGESEDEGSGSGGPQGLPGPTLAMNCSYTPTNLGVSAQQQLPPLLQWQGYAEYSDATGNVAATDYYDCNGSKGVHAVVFEVGKFF